MEDELTQLAIAQSMGQFETKTYDLDTKVSFEEYLEILSKGDLLVTEVYDFQMLGYGTAEIKQLPDKSLCILVEKCVAGPYGSSKYSEATHFEKIPAFFSKRRL